MGGEDLIRHVKSLKISWLRHIERKEKEGTPKYFLHNNMNQKEEEMVAGCKTEFEENGNQTLEIIGAAKR